MKIKKHMPAICTVLSVVGLAATCISVAKNTVKAVRIIEKSKKNDENVPDKVRIKRMVSVYAPSIFLAGVTSCCIFGIYSFSKKERANLVAAYMLLDQSYKQYKEKTKELYEHDCVNTIERQVVNANQPAPEPIEDSVLFFDFYTLRYFQIPLLDFIDAKYEINRQLIKYGYAKASYYYSMLGMPDYECFDNIGWSLKNNKWIEIEEDPIVLDDGLECKILTFKNDPSYLW